AASALEQVATRGSLVAKLPGSTRDDRAGEHAVVAANALVGRQVGVAYQRSDAQPAVRGGFNLVEAEAVDIDEMLWRFDLELHQVEQVGAARDEFCIRVAGRRSRCFSGRFRAFVGKGFHTATLSLVAASFIASMMLE